MNAQEIIDATNVIIDAINQQWEERLAEIRAEIERQQKWLLQAGCTAYNVDIALDAIKAVVAESERVSIKSP